jgi:hypothetical protein
MIGSRVVSYFSAAHLRSTAGCLAVLLPCLAVHPGPLPQLAGPCSLVPVPMAGCMISFGGYNGRYHNSVHVYRPEGYVVVKAPPRTASDVAERKPTANGGWIACCVAG